MKQLSNPSQELLEEWLAYTQYRSERVSSLDDVHKFWDSMSLRFPLLAGITAESIRIPVTSVGVERSLSNYKHLLNPFTAELSENLQICIH